MIVCVLLCALGALLRGEAKTVRSRVSVEEGRTLTLRCAFPGSDGSALQWLTPNGYTTFFNVLKDKRFQLQRSSPNRLVFSISNVTGEDEGVYKCLHYSLPVRAKEVNVIVWAAPSKPVIDVIHIPKKASKDEIVLNCSSSGGRPCPRITWLLGHTELSGNRRASFRDEDKKCSASSTLRISDFTHRSAVTCVVRHKSFSMGNSTATFNFSNLVAGMDTGDPPSHQTTPQTPPSAEVSTPAMNPTWEYDATSTGAEEQSTETTVGSLLERNTTLGTSGTDEEKEGRTDETTTVPEWIQTWETTETDTAPTGFGSETFPTGVNSTQQDVPAETATRTAFPDTNTTQDLDFVTEINPKRTAEFESARGKSNSTVILILVSLMICVLLVIVHLFLMKLRKAHQAWKKENENSDQTLESNKSKSNNEDAPGPTRNAQAATNQNGSGIKYNNQVSM